MASQTASTGSLAGFAQEVVDETKRQGSIRP
jgi:hypothetical protein